ncbi:MAG TPA: DUF4350 domain-containing protein [Candidatus Brocadiia bacterium]|nr:DUF4350 domain-containing protein [Candidatus Brocadiia bacterium]
MRRRILTICAVLAAIAVVVLAAVTGRKSATSSRLGGSYGCGPQGCKALFILLQERGITVDRALSSQNVDIPGKGVMFLFLPCVRPISRTEARSICDWVKNGNTLIIMDKDSGAPRGDDSGLYLRGELGAYLLPSPEGVVPLIERLERHRVRTVRASGTNGYASEIEEVSVSDPPLKLTAEPGGVEDFGALGWQPVVKGTDSVFVLEKGLGEGRVLLVCSPSMISNRLIGRDDNARLAVNLTCSNLEPGGAVTFDEYHNGFGFSPAPLGATVTKGFVWCLIQLAVIGAAFAWRGLPRFGVPRLPLDLNPRTSADHIRATARLHREAGSEAYAAEILLRLRAGTHTIQPGQVDRSWDVPGGIETILEWSDAISSAPSVRQRRGLLLKLAQTLHAIEHGGPHGSDN